MPQNYSVNAGTLFEDFENADDFTIAGTGSVKAADTTNVKTGAQSLKVTTAVATTTSIVKTISLVPTRNGNWGIWVYIDDVANISQLDIFLSSTTNIATIYMIKTFTSGAGAFVTGWNFLSIPRDGWTATGGELWTNTMVRLKFRVWVPAGKTLNISFDSMYYGIYARPKVLITFDDGWTSAYTQGYGYMGPRGLKATYYIISNSLAAGADSADGYMSLASAQAMYAKGNDIANHTTDHSTLTILSEADFNTKVSGCSDYLVANNMPRAAYFLAYVGGSYDATVITRAQNIGILHGRTIVSGVMPTVKGLVSQYLHKCYNISNTTSLDDVKGYINLAIANGETVAILFHKLVESSSVSTEWNISDFQALINFLKNKVDGNVLDVVTVSEWYRGLTHPRPLV